MSLARLLKEKFGETRYEVFKSSVKKLKAEKVGPDVMAERLKQQFPEETAFIVSVNSMSGFHV